MLSLIVLLLTVRYFASSFSNSQERTIEKPITRSAIIDTVAFRQTKIELLKVEIMNWMNTHKKDDWNVPNDKMEMVSPDGGEMLINFSKSGFRAKRA